MSFLRRRLPNVIGILAILLVAGTIRASNAANSPDENATSREIFRWFIVVRHAEKAAEPKQDPPLTDYGETRAELLRTMLLEAGATTLLATELIRTQRTLEPLAAELGLLIDVKESDDPYGMAAEAIRLDQPVTVIAAHSDTIVPILTGLTGQESDHFSPIRYDDFFLVARLGSKASVLRLQYAPPEQRD